MVRVRPRHRPPLRENEAGLIAGAVVRFESPSGPALGVVTSTGHGVHVQHLLSTPIGLMRAHRKCSTPGAVTRVAVRAPRWVKEKGAFRDPLRGCDSCVHRRNARRARTVVHTERGVEYAGERYHPGELAMFRSDERGQPFELGLVRRFGAAVEAQLCGRNRALGIGFEDEIYLTPDVVRRPYEDLRGKAAINLPEGMESSYPVFRLRHRLAEAGLVPLQREREPCACILADARRTARLRALRPDAVDLYAGGGGSALGLSAHFSLAAAVDIDPSCAATLRANFPAAQILQSPVAQLTAHSVPQPALLVAGPPCQGFTRLNPRRSTDARGVEMAHLAAAVSRLKPGIVVVENVPGFKDRQAAHGVQWNAAEDLVRSLLELGYQVRYAVLDAASYGAPQYRKRLFVLAAKRGMALPSFPEPTHANARPARTIFLGDDFSADDGTAPFPPLSAGEAVGDLPSWSYSLDGAPHFNPFQTEAGLRRCDTGPPRSRYAQRLQSRGQAREHITAGCAAAEYGRILDAGPPGRSSGTDQRAPPGEPVNTQLGLCRVGGKTTNPIHWADDRQFTLLERRRFQGFPDDYTLVGPLEAREQMVGNAVQVSLMEAIAGQVKRDAFGAFVAM